MDDMHGDTTGLLDELCINTIRTLAMDGVQKAKSGHPGMPMGMVQRLTSSGRASSVIIWPIAAG